MSNHSDVVVCLGHDRSTPVSDPAAPDRPPPPHAPDRVPLAGPHLSEGSRPSESPWASNHGVCVPTPNRGRPVATDESTMALAQIYRPSNSRRAPGSRGLGIESASQPASVAAVIGISKCTGIHCRDAAFLPMPSVSASFE